MTTLLIVDDDDLFGTTIGRDLTDHGYEVRLAHDADEATAIMQSEQIDVLLTDLRMPGADGIDLLDRVRTIAPRTRTILMSGYATARDYQRAIECGAIRVLCKPFTSSELTAAIRQAIDCETGFRGSIHGLSLVDLLQMFHYARRSLAIVVDGWAPGHVFLDEGRIIHATYRDESGELALRTILAMPAGSLRTMVLPESTPRTITRDFEGLLLDALRTMDEAQAAAEIDSWDLADFDDPATAAPVVATPTPRPRLQIFLERLRKIDGYTTACLVDSSSGVILGTDGEVEGIDLQAVVADYAALYRSKCAAVQVTIPDDRLEDIIITFPRHHHVLHAVGAPPSPCFLYVAMERNGSIALVTRALAAAEVALEA